jgi:hypothetical protein
VKASRKVILLLCIFLYPVIFFGLDGRVDKKKFGSYSVVLSQSFEDGLGKIIITHGKDKVFESSEIDPEFDSSVCINPYAS